MIGVLVTEGNTPERLGAATVVLECKEELSDTEVVWVRESKIRQSCETAEPFGSDAPLKGALGGFATALLASSKEAVCRECDCDDELRGRAARLFRSKLRASCQANLWKCS